MPPTRSAPFLPHRKKLAMSLQPSGDNPPHLRSLECPEGGAGMETQAIFTACSKETGSTAHAISRQRHPAPFSPRLPGNAAQNFSILGLVPPSPMTTQASTASTCTTAEVSSSSSEGGDEDEDEEEEEEEEENKREGGRDGTAKLPQSSVLGRGRWKGLKRSATVQDAVESQQREAGQTFLPPLPVEAIGGTSKKRRGPFPSPGLTPELPASVCRKTGGRRRLSWRRQRRPGTSLSSRDSWNKARIQWHRTR
ncbi:hypothetical protein Naga_100882g1 [Nannochloropsis gaditana]|uniref:Uncharacterized protein n=1 Tax=Nannochloropsis gaditana TaxID=72520 RepID=W7TMV9_9STRA|nr:hypothetical protein Naga_100882g1 [Nannochloropsis gaditana]